MAAGTAGNPPAPTTPTNAYCEPPVNMNRLSTHVCHTRSEEHTSELQSLMRISYAVFCLKKKRNKHQNTRAHQQTQVTKTQRLSPPPPQKRKSNHITKLTS